jgi:DNA-binding CsgD family transcriptional regulator
MDKYKLTTRQTDVLNCLLKGWSTRKIGLSLFITERTVQAHLREIYSKLNVKSRTEAVTKILNEQDKVDIVPAPAIPCCYKDTANVFDIILLNILNYKLQISPTNNSAEYRLAESAFIARNNCSLKFIRSLNKDYIEELDNMCNLIKFQ